MGRPSNNRPQSTSINQPKMTVSKPAATQKPLPNFNSAPASQFMNNDAMQQASGNWNAQLKKRNTLDVIPPAAVKKAYAPPKNEKPSTEKTSLPKPSTAKPAEKVAEEDSDDEDWRPTKAAGADMAVLYEWRLRGAKLKLAYMKAAAKVSSAGIRCIPVAEKLTSIQLGYNEEERIADYNPGTWLVEATRNPIVDRYMKQASYEGKPDILDVAFRDASNALRNKLKLEDVVPKQWEAWLAAIPKPRKRRT